ncbi:hypothetical protein JB92DRAFT_2934194 [Gautieria morchelliformis]|nr:hypothetical protein JB92DRAFT_2934194 [Gautieria morchelliformis]
MSDTESSSGSSSHPSALQSSSLALFQSMGKLLRHNPTAVTARLSAWLADPNSPHFWAPFALSMRGFAYEVMDELDLARMDYAKGLRLYDSLAMEMGKEAVKRMESNANFMRIRIRILPPPKPVPRRNPDYVVIDESDYYLRTF